jgi:peptidoglycan/LPS O-acetylase OafA/YrhL
LRSYSPQLDGLRALAVAAVAWSHWERPYQFGIPFGAGVHLFYVLSGFLITRILLDVRDQADRMSGVRVFYVRRALRIFPAFYVTLAFAWWADVPPVRSTFAWHATYLSNVHVFLTETWPGSISHFWSLAVEEQFYLAWPWLIVFAPTRCLKPAIAVAIATAPIFRWWLAALGYRENLLGVLTPGSLDSLGMGALLALMHQRGEGLGRVTPAVSVAGLTVLTVGEGITGPLPLPLMAAKQTLQAVVFAWLVVRGADGFGGCFGRILSVGPIVYTGRISYGIYLVHGFAGDILLAVGVNSRALPEPWRFLILCTMTVAIAAVSWHLMEKPINGLKRRVPYEPPIRCAARAQDQFAMR